MIVYSKKILRFVSEIKRTVKEVLSREINLKVTGDRFYDKPQHCYYPIKIVIYNNKSMLGYFDPNFYELGFHECLRHSSRQQLDNLWDQAQHHANLRGTAAKKSFFLGLAKGYCNKIHALKRDLHRDMTNALMVIEKK